MKLQLSRTFFAPLAALLFLLSLSSCGKDYDLVSEYVIRDVKQPVLLNATTNNAVVSTAIVNDITSTEVKKK